MLVSRDCRSNGTVESFVLNRYTLGMQLSERTKRMISIAVAVVTITSMVFFLLVPLFY
jgi:hypothetical protein